MHMLSEPTREMNIATDIEAASRLGNVNPFNEHRTEKHRYYGNYKGHPHINDSFSNKPPLAIVSILGTAKHWKRDHDIISHASCYASSHHIPFFVETATPGGNFYDKQLAVLKYLPHYEWILYVDTDTHIDDSMDILEWFAARDKDAHVIFGEAFMRPTLRRIGVDAGVFAVRSSKLGRDILLRWSSLQGFPALNYDNGVANILILEMALGDSYHGSCDKELITETGMYHLFCDCFYSVILAAAAAQQNSTLSFKSTQDPEFLHQPLFQEQAELLKPFQVIDWFQENRLVSYFPERKSLVYHNKDVHDIFQLQLACHDDQNLHRYNDASTPPVFVHVPWTGGGRIESALKYHNILVGAYTARDDRMPYPTLSVGLNASTQMHYCRPWHRPPSQPVPNSYVFVRDPIERMVDIFQQVHDNWQDRRFPFNCYGWRQWLELVFASLDNEDGLMHCYFIPQHEYARYAEFVFPSSLLESNSTGWRLLSHMYGIAVTEPEENTTEMATSHQKFNAMRCLPRKTKRRLNDMVAGDYFHLANYFQRHTLQ